MNLICPHCQKLLTVPEQNAGQLMKCPMCNNTFPVPALPQTPIASGSTTAPPGADAGAEIFSLAPEPAGAPSSAPRREERNAGRAAAEPARRVGPDKAPPPLPGTDYQHVYSLRISPRVVPLVAPIALFFILILLFFPWVGSYPGGHSVYTQSAFEMLGGGHRYDVVGEKVLNYDKKITENIGLSGLMYLYVLLLLVTIALVVLPLIIKQRPILLPAALESIWPWRSQLAFAGMVLVFAVLLLQSWWGFGLENAMRAIAYQSIAPPASTELTPEEQQQLEIKRGAKVGELSLQRAVSFRLAELFHLLAIAGTGLELWLERRGKRPLPRIEMQW
jgi:hypothetical protein